MGFGWKRARHISYLFCISRRAYAKVLQLANLLSLPLSWNEIKARAVDRAYRSAPFDTERARVEHLFTLYQSLTTLFPEKPKKKPRRARTVTP